MVDAPLTERSVTVATADRKLGRLTALNDLEPS